MPSKPAQGQFVKLFAFIGYYELGIDVSVTL
jgi:hypothetical protein